MISKKIDKSKLKVKHVIGMYQDLPGYPTAEDIFYDMLMSYCASTGDRKLVFTTNMITKRYPSLTEDTMQNHLAALESKGLISKQNETSVFSSYKIELNPYE